MAIYLKALLTQACRHCMPMMWAASIKENWTRGYNLAALINWAALTVTFLLWANARPYIPVIFQNAWFF